MTDEEPGFILFTPEKLTALKAVYEKHKDWPGDTFTFEGHEYLVSYAKYVIEYLESKFQREAARGQL